MPYAGASENLKTMKIKSFLTGLVAVVMLALFSGCAALVVGAAAGAGTYAYVQGELQSTESASLDRTWAATQGAIKELQFTVTTQQKDALLGRLIARTAKDKKIEINLKKTGDHLTEVRIRVGTFGDEELSRLILDKIKSRL